MTIDIIRSCEQLIYRYAYLNDERDFEALMQLFTEDALLYRPSAPDTPLQGHAAILASFRSRSPDLRTFHTCSDIEVSVEHAQLAHARSRILLLSASRSAQSATAIMLPDKPPMPGTFRDQFQLTADGWKFSQRRGSFWI